MSSFHLYLHIEEKADETKTENEADSSATKPNENQISLSMCVNTDDVQDDLDEDLKELEKVDVIAFPIFKACFHF